MESIKDILGSYPKERTILSPNNSDIEPPSYELTLEERRERLRADRGLSSLNHTFENFLPEKGTGAALAAFKAIASGKDDRMMILLYGGVGNGKTHLCEAVVIALYKRGIWSRIITMSKVMRALKQAMNPDLLISYDILIQRYCEAPRLIIDDVGMGGSGSDWEFGQLEEIVVRRYHERLFTILTTNLDIAYNPKHPDARYIPERIVSRFRDREVAILVCNTAADYRSKK